MAVSVKQILEYADCRLNDVSCEVGARMVVGRAYYASYHRANSFHNSLSSKGFRPEDKGEKTKGVHRALIYQLYNPRVADPETRQRSRHLARLLNTICKLRQDADYELGKQINKTQARQAVAESKKLYEFLNEYGG